MTNYNPFAETFSASRINMKWEEIEYFLSFLEGKKDLKILDIGCGNGRLLGELIKKKIDFKDYLGIDSSKGLIDKATEQFPGYNFYELDMLNLDEIPQKFNIIFFIASFHHLENYEDRVSVMKNAYNLLEDDGFIFMTNWALDSEFNSDKYNFSKITGSENKFLSTDYDIKIGGFSRYYHCFNLKEIEEICKETGLKIIKNEIFSNKKNYISILQK